MASILGIRKGDIIIERVNGKKSMTPVRSVEFNACSKFGVHVNGNACYDNTSQVDIVLGEETLGDLQDAVSEQDEEFPTEEDLQDAYRNSIEAWADKLVRI